MGMLEVKEWKHVLCKTNEEKGGKMCPYHIKLTSKQGLLPWKRDSFPKSKEVSSLRRLESQMSMHLRLEM